MASNEGIPGKFAMSFMNRDTTGTVIELSACGAVDAQATVDNTSAIP